jgi:hypothetical protein
MKAVGGHKRDCERDRNQKPSVHRMTLRPAALLRHELDVPGTLTGNLSRMNERPAPIASVSFIYRKPLAAAGGPGLLQSGYRQFPPHELGTSVTLTDACMWFMPMPVVCNQASVVVGKSEKEMCDEN